MSIAGAARLILEGGLVAFPTETVYGLGGDATNERAVAAIFEAKGRPQFNPLISHVLDAAEAKRFVRWNDTADKLAARFWPGPLTLVLPRAQGLADRAAGHGRPRHGRDPRAGASDGAGADPRRRPADRRALGQSQRRRQPDPRRARGRVAGRSGEDDPRRRAVRRRTSNSTVLDLTTAPPTLLRPGGATREAIEAVIGPIALSDALPSGDSRAQVAGPARQPLRAGAAGAAGRDHSRRR